MRLKVNPLVVAAALGLLGPAALSDEDEEAPKGLAGVWHRRGGGERSPLPMGDRIEVIPFEGTVLLDDGAHGPNGLWTLATPSQASQELRLGETTVRRTFEVDGDSLAVRTTVTDALGTMVWSDTYERMG